MLNFSAKILAFVSILLTSNLATAGQLASLYYVAIPVIDESAEVRLLAFDQGLDEVFVRISGDSIIMDKMKRPPSSRYVKQFSYEPLSAPASDDVINTTTNESGEVLTHRIKIQYNGSLVQKYLLDNGFPVWGEHRPDVVIWLVVRDGRNEYILKDSDQSILKASTGEALTRRGIPGRWPLYDYKDKKALNVADIRGGFKEPVVNASKRYASETALTGSMIWNGEKWQSGWSLFAETENRHWNLEDSDYKQLINKAIDQAADRLGVVYAVHNAENKQQVVGLQLDIQAINTIEKYRYVETYLSGLSVVENVKPDKVDGQNAVFEVALRSSEEDFFNLIRNEAELIEVKSPPLESQVIPENEPAGNTEKDSAIDTVTGEAVVEKSEVSHPPKQMPVYYYRLNQH